MFGGIGGLGQLAGLLGKLPKLREEMDKLAERLNELKAEGNAGGGMVTVRVNGTMTVLGCVIAPEALADRELLEDLIVAATNQAIAKVKVLVTEVTQKMAVDLGLPPGLNLPGLS